MTQKSGRVRIQPSISQLCADWIESFAQRWDMSKDVAAAKILEAVSESPWVDLILKQPDTDISIERMEVLIKKKIEESEP